MKEILKIIKNYKFIKKEFFLFLFFSILMEIIYIFFPQFARIIIWIIENRWNLNDLYLWIAYLWIFTLVAVCITLISNYFWNKMWLLLYSRKSQFYRGKIFEKNFKDLLDVWTWKLITRIDNWVNAETDIFHRISTIFISAIFKWILVIIILSFYIPKLIFILLLWIFILLIVNFYLRKYIKKHNKKEQELWEIDWKNKAKIIMENLIIRIFWKQKYELGNSNKILEKIPYHWTRVDTANILFYQFLEFLLRLFEMWVYIIIWTLIIKEWNLQISYLIMIIGYIWFLWWPLDKAISDLNTINRGWEKYKKLQDFIEQEIEIKNWRKKFEYKNWEIEFKNVGFSYNKSKEIFNNLNIQFLKWKKNALVWHSWWGKSTIVKIILRLFDYKTWEVLIDWQELKTLKIETLYKNIGYLPQEPAVFDWTIRENLEYAFDWKIKNKDKIIWQALKKSRIDKMIKWLEKWLETEIWEKWIKLSWWEKQRLAIARIFLKDPEIIILDEPTSSLDSISEASITDSLNELMKWRTSIVIAHRLQTVMYSDKIIVLEEWKIEAEWLHSELIKKSNIYKTLVDLQNGKIME